MILSIDIGATKTLLALYNQSGTVLRQHKFNTESQQKIFEKRLTNELDSFLDETKLTVIAIGAPGAVDYSSGTIMRCGNLPWRNFQIAKTLKPYGAAIVLDNDANLGGLAEAKIGSGAGHSLVLYITIGTGVGTGIIKDGQIILEHSEGGLMITDYDHPHRFERVMSGSSIYRKYNKYGFQIKNQNIWNEIAKSMAVGIYNMLSLVGPDVVVIGGGIGVHFDHYIQPLRDDLESIYTNLWPLPPIKQAKYPETAVIEGCFLAGKSYLAKSKH